MKIWWPFTRRKTAEFACPCTLHPNKTYEIISSGLICSDAENIPGNPNCSVLGTLHDLCLELDVDSDGVEDPMSLPRIMHMALGANGLEGVYETVLNPPASKFPTRKQMNEYQENPSEEIHMMTCHDDRSRLAGKVVG